jgi:hypothetical protein
MKPDFSKYEVDINAVKPDSEDPNYTDPLTYGVYHITSIKKSASTKSFRFGNYPVRLHELHRDFDSVKLIALYTNRDIAIQHAKYANKEL